MKSSLDIFAKNKGCEIFESKKSLNESESFVYTSLYESKVNSVQGVVNNISKEFGFNLEVFYYTISEKTLLF